MKLTKLTLTNFKGIRDRVIEAPDGCSLNIYGNNGTGKTTVADAITYILFGKDSAGRAPENFGIKTRRVLPPPEYQGLYDGDDSVELGEVIHNLDHVVEATFIEPDMTLKRVYKEKWTRSRGSATKELTGHTTDYFVDDEEVKKKDFEEAVSKVMTDEQFKILTVPSYFAEDYHWTDRRKVLQGMAGDVTDQMVIDLSPASDLEEYHDILDGKTAESRKSILSNKRKNLIETIDDIPNRIDENQRSIKPVNVEEIESELAELGEKKDELTEKLSNARSGGGVSDLQVKLEEIETERQEMVSSHMESLEREIEDKRKVLNDARTASDDALEAVRDAKSKVDYEQTKVELAEREIDETKEEIQEIEANEPPPKPEAPENGNCPYCNAPMESDHNHEEELKKWEKEVAEFNEKKAEELKSLAEDLDSAQTILEERQKAYAKAVKAHTEAVKTYEPSQKVIDKAKEELQAVQSKTSEVQETDAYKELIERKEKLTKKIDKIRSDKQGTIDSIQEQISGVTEQIKALEEQKLQQKKNEETNERIKELKDELNSAQDELEDAEHGLYVIQQFELAQAKIITDRVNDLFDIVTWKMFERQMNGSINDQMCEPVVNGIPYSDGLNNAMRIQAGLDIINTIGKHYNAEAPVILDNAESVVKLNTYDLQVISLYVSEKDEQLRIEEI